MNWKLLPCLAISAALAACSSDSNNSSLPDNAGPAFYDYAASASGQLASINTRTGESEIVAQNVAFIRAADILNNEGEFQGRLTVALSEGRFVKWSDKGNQAEAFSSLSGMDQDDICAINIHLENELLALIYSTAGDDQDCDNRADNPAFYIDTAMDDETAPQQLSTNILVSGAQVDPIYDGAEVKGYIAVEGSGVAAQVNYYDPRFSRSVTVQTPAGHDFSQDYLYLFPRRDRPSVIRLGAYFYEVTHAQLQAGSLGQPFLSKANFQGMAIGEQYTYVAADGAVFRYDSSASKSTELPTISLAGDVRIAMQTNGAVFVSEDKTNSNIVDFTQVKEREGQFEFDALLAASYDTQGTNGSSFNLASTGRSALANVELRYQSRDDEQYALLIDEQGGLARFDGGKWLFTIKDSLYQSHALLAQKQDEGMVISLIDEAASNAPLTISARVFGRLPSGITNVRMAYIDVAGQYLIFTESNDAELNNLIYRFNIDRAGSLQKVDGLQGFRPVNS